MRIAISPTLTKVLAAQQGAARASNDLGVEITVIESKYKFPSGIPDQPLELIEAHLGAYNRARDVLGAPDATEATHALGIENAAAYMGRAKWTDPAVIVLLDRQGRETVVSSVGVPMANKDLGEAIAAGQVDTAGSRIAKRLGCDVANWHKHMSNGLTPRDMLIADAVYTAIVWAVLQAE